ncbi:hypothetical protein [Enterococcus termitis]|uniref:hypothetical protein n=1 Tax=Enterococcus termitis TaxID=332950 RepID=UPI001112E204|nr:hypothetical protein [Enterococcus termitis]
MKENQFVVFLLSKNSKDIYKGKFIKIDQLSVHEDISSKIHDRMTNNQIKKRTGQRLLDQLDRSLEKVKGQVLTQTSFSPPIEEKASEVLEEIVPEKSNEKKVLKKKNINFFFPVNKKIVLVGICSSFMLVAFFVGVKFYFSSAQDREAVVVKNRFDDLLDKGNFIEACNEYPDKKKEIVSYLTEENLFSELKDFQKEYPTDVGAFELAFYEKKWDKVVESPLTDLSEDRQIMLAHAYIELGKLSEAEILNKKLKSDVIDRELSYSYKVKAIQAIQESNLSEAEEIQKKLKDSDLGELIDTAKLCREMIEHYKKEKDVENQKIWLNKLENLGKELLPNESGKENQ